MFYMSWLDYCLLTLSGIYAEIVLRDLIFRGQIKLDFFDSSEINVTILSVIVTMTNCKGVEV